MSRRRAIQEEYNRREGIRPESIRKGVTDVLAAIYEREYDAVPLAAEAVDAYGSLDEVDRVVRELEREMREAAARLDFERAAALRDRVRGLKELELAVGVGGGAKTGGAAAPAAARRRPAGREAAWRPPGLSRRSASACGRLRTSPGST